MAERRRTTSDTGGPRRRRRRRRSPGPARRLRALGVAVGTGVGAALGVAAGDLSLWLPAGAVLGFLGGLVAGARPGFGLR